jgi:hypothetical protein
MAQQNSGTLISLGWNRLRRSEESVPETGRGLFALRKSIPASLSHTPLHRCPYFPARAAIRNVLQPTSRERLFVDVNAESGQVRVGTRITCQQQRGARMDLVRDALARALAAQFCGEIILLQGGTVSQQLKQGIFQIFPRSGFRGNIFAVFVP